MQKLVLVIGATGAMGRQVVAALLSHANKQFTVRAFTRDPSSEQAIRLKETGGSRLELMRGDLDDQKSLEVSMDGAWGVFCNTDFWSSASVEEEFQQGVRVLEIARNAQVEHVVYSSLDDCTQLSGGRIPVPHYDAKAAVEHFIDRHRSHEFLQQQSDGFYSRHVSVLVTATYFENLIDNFRPEKGKLSDGREGFIFRIPAADKPYPMIALDDIAWFATDMFANSETWGGRTLKVVGDGPTMYEVAATFERITGIPAEYQPMDLDVLRKTAKAGHTVANKFLFTQEFGFVRDYEELRRIHPALMTFADWLKTTGWRGEPGKVQKGHVVIGAKGSYQP
jgi:uncharacterized protein YbjT (DUF2867 family)